MLGHPSEIRPATTETPLSWQESGNGEKAKQNSALLRFAGSTNNVYVSTSFDNKTCAVNPLC